MQKKLPDVNSAVTQLRGKVHRTILVFDVEGFNDGRRLTEDQRTVRDGYYRVLQDTFSELGIEWSRCTYEDRGDGLFILVPAEVDKTVFCDSFPLKLASRLREYNYGHRSTAIIRLRMALNAGEIDPDDHGVTSSALNRTFRLVNANVFRDFLHSSSGCLAIIASSWFYGEVIRKSLRFRPHSYQPIRVEEKETTAIGWVALPDATQAADQGAGESWRVRILDQDGRAHGAGVLLNGRYIITSAGVVRRSLACRGDDRPTGQVSFDLPLRPHAGVRQAQTLWWTARTGPETGLAVLSVVGPALKGVNRPVLQRDGLEAVDIVRVRRFEQSGKGPSDFTAWGCLPRYSENGHGPVVISQVDEYALQITDDCCGADVIDPRTGAIVGITVTIPRNGQHPVIGMVPLASIVSQWPSLSHIVAAAWQVPDVEPEVPEPMASSRQHRTGTRSHRFSHSDLVQLIDAGMEVPELAQAPSRHQITADLPPQISLTAPRSSVDRADLAGLLWACTETSAGLTELRRVLEKDKPHGPAREKLLKDLDRLLLP